MTGKRTYGGMTEDEGRAAIIAEARTWLGTPYIPGAMARGVGVDCGKLIQACYQNPKIVAPMDVRPYPADWHKHKKDEMYLRYILSEGHMIQPGQQKPGDVAMWKFGHTRSHGAIIVEWPIVIHATLHERTTWQCDVADDLRYGIHDVQFYSYWP